MMRTGTVCLGVVLGSVVGACAFAAGLQGGAQGTTSGTGTSTLVQVVTVPATTPAVTVGKTSTPTPAPPSATATPPTTAAAVLAADKLPPLNLSDMRLWNWAGVWHASEWDNGESPLPWRYNHVRQPARGDTIFTLDTTGAPQLQGQGGTPAAANGMWESEVTLPKLRDGLIVAPLWLYDPASKDEIDFELAGRKGLDVTLHAYVNGAHKSATARLFAGRDLSGERHRFGIKVNQTAGFVEMYVDGQRVYSWSRSSMSFFVSKPLKPFIEMWAAKPTNSGYVQWAGKWTGITAATPVTMTVHGYRYTTLR